MTEATSGYCDCACRDCFRGPIIGVAGVTMCDACQNAGCEPDSECQAPLDDETEDEEASGDPVQDVVNCMDRLTTVAGLLHGELNQLHTAYTAAANEDDVSKLAQPHFVTLLCTVMSGSTVLSAVCTEMITMLTKQALANRG